MNESITCEEVLHLARHLHACMDEVVKSLQLLAAGADGVVLPAGSAGAFRTLADYIERPPSMAATKAGITLRRAAERLEPLNPAPLTTHPRATMNDLIAAVNHQMAENWSENRAVGRIRCEHCEGTGVEPGPAVQRTLDVEEYL